MRPEWRSCAREVWSDHSPSASSLLLSLRGSSSAAYGWHRLDYRRRSHAITRAAFKIASNTLLPFGQTAAARGAPNRGPSQVVARSDTPPSDRLALHSGLPYSQHRQDPADQSSGDAQLRNPMVG